LIGLYGYFGGRLSGRGVPASILHALAVGLIGAFLIGFKVLLH
jgi:VIT1/CCC1 family predicted Fe2+/Mn2+ transporter